MTVMSIDNCSALNVEGNEPQRHREHRGGEDQVTKFRAALSRNGMSMR
jgi:hypothetical protein